MGPDVLARLCAQQRGERHELHFRPSTFCLHPKPHLHLRGSASLETWSERCKKSVHTPTSPSILYHVSICASPCLKQEQGRKHNSGSLAASKRQRQGRGRSQRCARPMEDSAQIASTTVTHTTKAMPFAISWRERLCRKHLCASIFAQTSLRKHLCHEASWSTEHL